MGKPIDQRTRNREHDAKRRAEKPWRAWYNTPEWKAARKAQLTRQPLCERHLKRGEKVRASVVNHIGRHGGNWHRFINGPFESVCKGCHDSAIQREEKRGLSCVGVDVTGRPTDPNHPWNKRA